MDKALARGGLSVADIDVVELSLPDMTPALANGSIDAALQTEPTVTLTVERGAAVRWKNGDEIYLNQEFNAWVYGPGFGERQPEAARRFMVALLRGARDYVNAFERGVNKPAVVDILVQYTPVKDRSLYDKMVLSGLNPNGYINLDNLRADLDWYAARGLVPGGMDLSTIVDHQYVDYALQRLGAY